MPFHFDNRTGDSVYVPYCGGRLDWHLERDEGTWRSLRLDYCPAVLVEPLVLAPNAALLDTALVTPGPTVPPSMLRGTFRIVFPMYRKRSTWTW